MTLLWVQKLISQSDDTIIIHGKVLKEEPITGLNAQDSPGWQRIYEREGQSVQLTPEGQRSWGRLHIEKRPDAPQTRTQTLHFITLWGAWLTAVLHGNLYTVTPHKKHENIRGICWQSCQISSQTQNMWDSGSGQHHAWFTFLCIILFLINKFNNK